MWPVLYWEEDTDSTLKAILTLRDYLLTPTLPTLQWGLLLGCPSTNPRTLKLWEKRVSIHHHRSTCLQIHEEFICIIGSENDF